MCSFSQQKNNATLVKDKENVVDKEISAGLRYQLYFYFIGGCVERRKKKTLVVLGFSVFLLSLPPVSPAALRTSCCLKPINIAHTNMEQKSYLPTSQTWKEKAVNALLHQHTVWSNFLGPSHPPLIFCMIRPIIVVDSLHHVTVKHVATPAVCLPESDFTWRTAAVM